MKQNLKITALTIVISFSTAAWAQNQGSMPPPPPHGGGPDFMLGLCVGQTLAAQGIALTLPTIGQPPTPPDATTKAEIDSARQTCLSILPTPPAPPSNASN